MTALDVEMAKDLVTQLGAQAFVDAANVHHTHDVEFELEDIVETEIHVDGTVALKRIARGRFATDVTLDLVVVKKQDETGTVGDADSHTEKDDWLAFIDNDITEFLKSASVLSRLPMSIEFVKRFDSERLRRYAVFYTHMQLEFPRA